MSTKSSAAARLQKNLSRTLLQQEVLLLLVFLTMITVFTLLNSRFFTSQSFANVLQDWGPIMVIAIGQTYVVITAGIDLSVGSVMGLSGICGAMTIRTLTEHTSGPAPSLVAGILAALAVGALVGFVNGFLITKTQLAPFIATLATMATCAGLILVITGGLEVAGGPNVVYSIGGHVYLKVLTAPLIVAILIVALAWSQLHLTRFGRWTYAVGSSNFAARAAGVAVDRHLIKVYTLSGTLAGVAGMMVYFRLGSGSATTGRGAELTAIAAVIIGGASLFGGKGRMGGTLLGALIITSVLSGLILVGVEPNWQQVVIGLLIGIAVFAQRFEKVGSGE